MNFQYSFDYSGYNGIKGDDKSLSIYEGDWRSGGDVITREFAPVHQHEADRYTYEAAVKYLKSHTDNSDAIIEKLNQCEWVKQMNEADNAEKLGTIYLLRTRVKKSWDNVSYDIHYLGDTEEEAEEKRMKYGNVSGKGKYMPGIGKMYEVALTIEGYQSSGKAEIYKNDLRIEGTYSEAQDIEVEVDEEAIKKLAESENPGTPEDAGFFESTFETGAEGWITRGGPLLTVDKEQFSEGSQSLFVSGRTDYWNGATILLSSDTYHSGEAYHFRAKVMQNSGETATMKMTLQYNLDGEKYDEIALGEAPSGEWITLENLAYTIPEGAENLQLYLESTDSLTDFYIDEVSGAERAD